MLSREAITKEEAAHILTVLGKEMTEAKDKEAVLNILKRAGGAVGFKPAFRCLVMGETPERSIHW